ncbi:unnamed protein product [Eruca vesicaria subsp. sativa]|uniref:Uncharacterized protein n=1 Tax=Eruca vesicaria subsp. sativa TaxID=29727 RepID=A0ABC8JPS0_ERUVS|nr:unnamed protein product [Eruca vesicaria subsp. sativa]
MVLKEVKEGSSHYRYGYFRRNKSRKCVYICGFRQGGELSLDTYFTGAQRLVSVLLYLLEEVQSLADGFHLTLQPSISFLKMLKRYMLYSSRHCFLGSLSLSRLLLYADTILRSHGIDDRTVLLEAGGQAALPFLQQAGITCEFKGYPESWALNH